jgi:CDP-glucose 4,6-dehydratase
VRAIVCVTSDKCYQDREWVWGHREVDALGGNDPYSASKAGAEIVAQSYSASLLPQEGRIRLATARGGNVVGGGDWSEDRLVPDLVRAGLTGNPLVLRNPQAVRPWQHVLELIRGYCVLGARLLNGDHAADGAWNFGPASGNEVTVNEVVSHFLRSWGAGSRFDIRHEPSPLREAPHLRLDISKARIQLGWSPKLTLEETIGLTVDWYRAYAQNAAAAAAITHEQLASYRAATGFA